MVLQKFIKVGRFYCSFLITAKYCYELSKMLVQKWSHIALAAAYTQIIDFRAAISLPKIYT